MDVIKDLEELAEIISIAIAREKASVEYYTQAFRKARSAKLPGGSFPF